MISMMRSGWTSGLALPIAFTIAATISFTASFTAASPASAGDREDPISGKSAQIVGLTRVKTSFAPRVTRDDYMDVIFTEGRFTAQAVSGTYTQHGKKLRFQVDEERLLAFESGRGRLHDGITSGLRSGPCLGLCCFRGFPGPGRVAR